MTNNSEEVIQGGSNVPILLTLLLAGFSSMISGLLSGLLLIDMGETFNVTVAIAGQMQTFSFIVSIIFALLTSLLSLKYSHKLLLQIGLLAYIFSSVGCFLAPSFATVVLSFSLTGIGYALSTTMVFTLVSDLFSLEKRGEVIGLIIAGMSGSYLIGAFVVPVLQAMGGWRMAFIGYMFPSSLLTLAMATATIPKSTLESNSGDLVNIKDSFKVVLSNRSAVSSLLGYLLAMVTWQSIMTYNTSFFRETFSITIGKASLFILIGATLYTLGSIISGKMVNRFGRKPLTVLSIMIAGLVIMTYSYLPGFLASAGFLCLACLLVGIMDTASTSLILEQLPLYAGTMMSLSRVATQIGFSLGSGLGGMFLMLYSYRKMFSILGALGLASALVFHFLTDDTLTH
jgi:predicted MFS family arabinose efflux permease